jgi:uncharacterized membrane protein YccC
MTSEAAPSVPAPSRLLGRAVHWLRSRDPHLLVIKRSVRAAIVMPSAFAVGHGLFSDAQVGLFSAFGSFALLLLVEFTGRPRTRAVSYGMLYLVGSVFIVIGTLASSHEGTAVVSMAVVGFAVLFAGIVAPSAAAASTASLLLFVLPVAVAQPSSAIGPRLGGWTIAAAFCIPACLLVWPPPWHDELRRRLAATVSAMARLADARVKGTGDAPELQAVQTELAGLRTQFSATPYPPTGTAPGAVALSKLVGRVEWVAGNTAMIADNHWSTASPSARAVSEMVADTLQRAALVICDDDAHPVRDRTNVAALQETTSNLDQLIQAELNMDASALLESESGAEPARADPPFARTTQGDGFVDTLDPGFHSRALGIATEMVADAALEAAGAEPVVDKRLGMVEESRVRRYVHRLVSHFSFHSVWFRNSVRGAAGLAAAVAVVEVTDVSHGFWVVLGTLSVLRGNAVGTGATALRAVGGTAVGVAIGAVIMIGVADHTVLLWVLLPIVVFLAGAAPAIVSFVAGQAAFTLTVVILFNIIDPAGWRVGLTRIEDVAIGCGVSLLVGLLFWPRGARTALGRALSEAFALNSSYLADAVDRMTMTEQTVDTEPGQQACHRAYLLLDDAYRQYFAEQGTKVVPLDTVANLFTGANRLRLAAYTLGSLPVEPPETGTHEVESVAVAGAVLRDSYAATHRWYVEFADLLAERRDRMALPHREDEVLHGILQHAIDDVRVQRREDRMRMTLQMLWADELLENQSQMQSDLLASADLFVGRKRHPVAA